MSRQTNRQWLLNRRPNGAIDDDDFSFRETEVAELQDGQILLHNRYLSLDPAMRGWMNEGKSYIEPVGLGEVMRALGVGEVMASRHPRFSVGDHLQGAVGVQDYYLGTAQGFYPVDPQLAPLPRYLSALGMTGMTAYFALLEVGQPSAGDAVVISAAAGAVGSIAGQIARLKGCKVIGIAGGPEKCRWVVEQLGFSAAIDYRHEDVAAALQRECPTGVNLFFDNVGGELLDTVLVHLAPKARVVICGAISQYNSSTPVRGPANYLSLLVNRARMEGFVVLDYASRYADASREIAGWLAEGKLHSREDVAEGLQTFPQTLRRLFNGEHLGKLVLKL